MGKRSLIRYIGGKKQISVAGGGCSGCTSSNRISRSFSSVNEEIIPVPQDNGRVINIRFRVGQEGSYDDDTVEYLLAYGKSEINGAIENRFILLDGKI